MDWIQLIVFMLGNLALIFPMWLWARSESRSDMRHIEAKINTDIRHIDAKIDNLITAIQTETKDFHGRMCSLEAKQK